MIRFDFHSRSCLVVGGSRGIGAAIVRLLGQSGARVAWTHSGSDRGEQASRALEQELADADAAVKAFACDCCDASGMQRILEQIDSEWGPVQHLIYNAGITSPVAFDDLNLESWRQGVDVNLNGAFLAVKSALEQLRQTRGSVVLIGSAAHLSGGGGRADYTAAKSGLEGFCRAITKQLSSDGIRCNVVHPSLIDTELLRERHPDESKRNALGGDVPLGRLGEPKDIAQAATFLLSDAAGYITGQSLLVDGGRTLCG